MLWIKRFSEWFDAAQILIGLFSKIGLPAVAVGLAWYAGESQGAPLMWVIMATALTLMAVVVIRYYWAEYSYRNSPAHKLQFIGINTPIELVIPNRGVRRKKEEFQRIAKIQIGVVVKNTAHFPLSAFISNSSTSASDKTPPRHPYPTKPVPVHPGVQIIFSDLPIEMNGDPCQPVKARIDMVIKYGEKGVENEELKFNGDVSIAIQPNGTMTGSYIAWDATVIDV